MRSFATLTADLGQAFMGPVRPGPVQVPVSVVITRQGQGLPNDMLLSLSSGTMGSWRHCCNQAFEPICAGPYFEFRDHGQTQTDINTVMQ